jgi:hypothetical protein
MKRPDPKTPAGARHAPRPRSEWLVPASLLLLAAVPALGGIYRVLHVSLGGEVTPANQRFFDGPAPVVLHGVACALFAFLGAFQFTAGSRRRPRRHRLRGALFVPSALVVATTGLWMEASYELPAHDGDLLSVFRAVFGTAMIATTLLGVRALLRREYARHGAWMMRTYAIGMGAGTQVVVLLPWMLLVGEPDVFQRALLMGAGWAINVAFVEWILHRRARRNETPPAFVELAVLPRAREVRGS